MELEHLKNLYGKGFAPLENLDLQHDDYFVEVSDHGGFGACSTSYEGVISFPSGREFLAFLFYAEIPRIEEFRAGGEAFQYPAKLEGLKNLFEGCVSEGADVSIMLVNDSINTFNHEYKDTNPSVQYTAYGSLKEYVLKSDFLVDTFIPHLLTNWAQSDTDFSKPANWIKEDILKRINETKLLIDLLDFKANEVRAVMAGWIYEKIERSC